MNKAERLQKLIDALRDLANDSQTDWENRHVEADELLLAFIDNTEVTEAFDSIDKWYA